MMNASITLAKAIASGELAADDVTEDDFSSLLCTLRYSRSRFNDSNRRRKALVELFALELCLFRAVFLSRLCGQILMMCQ